MAQASFGIILFAIVHIAGCQFGLNVLSLPEKLTMDNYAVASLLGFVGGVAGRSVLKVVPVLRRAF